MEYTKALADFCAGVACENLPPDVIEKANLCILDYAANVYGSLQLEAVKKAAAYIRSLGDSEAATAFGCGFRASAASAAFINGVSGEAIEAQDGLRFGGNHPGAAVIPAALAVGERQRSSGVQIIEAVVAGYEAANRISAAIHPGHTLAGFLPTGTCGTFGAAVAAAKLSGADAAQILAALGAAGYVLPISMAEHLMGGYTCKIVQGGQAASAGITAAGLALAGLTSAPFVLEGSKLKGGFTQITTKTNPALEKITDGLGETYSIMDVYFKPYSACRHTHGAAQAAIEFAAEAKFNPSEIQSVDVFTYAIASIAVGKGFAAGDSFVSAQFSIPYVVAAALIDGAMGPGQLKESRMSDPAILALAGKVKVQMDNAIAAAYPQMTQTRIEVRLTGGRVFSRQIDIVKGDPRDTMTAADLSEKLKAFAPGRGSENLGEMIETILGLEKLDDITSLTKLMA